MSKGGCQTYHTSRSPFPLTDSPIRPIPSLCPPIPILASSSLALNFELLPAFSFQLIRLSSPFPLSIHSGYQPSAMSFFHPRFSDSPFLFSPYALHLVPFTNA